ncbi:GNAT family N-acetyltransferase [Kluyvera intermedia]|uniref:GNAT family N-acetyltransferase n=1 Tax=Kluyvera intermedia TaxID=61648 RepID=UPI003BA0A668
MYKINELDKSGLSKLHLDMPPSVGNVQLIMLDSYLDFQDNEVRQLFSTANENYPYFENWYDSKLVKDTVANKEKYIRHFKDRENDSLYDFYRHNEQLPDGRLVLVAAVNEKLAGLSVLKINPLEHKISTFFIDKKFNNIGLGTLLLNFSLLLLNDKEVNITVSEGALDQMTPFLIKNGFREYKSVPDEYVNNKKETHFIKK